MPKCAAKSKRTGKQCGAFAAAGSTVCKWHGAGAPQVKAAAERRLVIAHASEQVELWGGRRDVHPAQALLELVGWKAAEVAYWRWRVSQVAEDDLTWGTTKRKQGGEDWGETEEAKPHIALVLLRQAEQDLAAYASAALKAGAEAARVAIAQQHADQLSLVLQRVLSDPRVTIEAGAANQVVLDALKVLGEVGS